MYQYVEWRRRLLFCLMPFFISAAMMSNIRTSRSMTMLETLGLNYKLLQRCLYVAIWKLFLQTKQLQCVKIRKISICNAPLAATPVMSCIVLRSGDRSLL